MWGMDRSRIVNLIVAMGYNANEWQSVASKALAIGDQYDAERFIIDKSPRREELHE